MIIEFGNISINAPIWITIFICSILAFGITSIVIPSIIKLSRDKHLFDKPDQRKSHTSEIPTLGGAAIFLGMLIPTMLIGGISFEHELKYIILGLLILLFIGIKDDILEVSPGRKLIAELFAISIIVILGGIRVSSFHGFLGINELPYFVSLLFTLFMCIVIINGFNLIDGIDGLAAGVGILTISCLGIWFLHIGDNSYAAFCFSIVGALLAFFRFNVFGKQNKIFLGDTGSLILGMVVSIFTIKFLESSISDTVVSKVFPAPAISIGILIIPLIDTLRVFTLRILVGKSPFEADRYHTHHKFLLHGFSHLKTTLIILAFNLMVIILCFSFQFLGNIKMLLIIIPASILVTSIPGLFFRYRVRRFLTKINLLGNMSWVLPVTFTNLIISHSRRIKYTRPSYLNSPDDQSPQINKDQDKVLLDAYLKFGADDSVFEESAD